MLRAASAETEEQPDEKARWRVQDLESDDGRAATTACLGRVDYHEPTKTLSNSGHQAAQDLIAASAPSTSATPSVSIGAAVGIGIGGALTVLLLAASIDVGPNFGFDFKPASSIDAAVKSGCVAGESLCVAGEPVHVAS
ncbi:hypothetical protein GGG16DRAFT_117703 [Schizophyllum commune]